MEPAWSRRAPGPEGQQPPLPASVWGRQEDTEGAGFTGQVFMETRHGQAAFLQETGVQSSRPPSSGGLGLVGEGPYGAPAVLCTGG